MTYKPLHLEHPLTAKPHCGAVSGPMTSDRRRSTCGDCLATNSTAHRDTLLQYKLQETIYRAQEQMLLSILRTNGDTTENLLSRMSGLTADATYNALLRLSFDKSVRAAGPLHWRIVL